MVRIAVKKRSKSKRKKSSAHTPETFVFTEQAVSLLRYAPAKAWMWHFCGGIPFFIALTFFFTLLNESGRPDMLLLSGAFPAGLLYIWMKGCQAKFVQALWEGVGEDIPDPENQKGLWVRQCLLQPYGLFVVTLSRLFLLPYPLFSSFFQNHTLCEALPSENKQSVTSRAWSLANQKQLSCIGFLSIGKPALYLLVALNWMTVLILIPVLGYSLSGIANPFVNSFNAFNTVAFWMAVWSLTYLTVDPFIKAFYLLKAEYLRSRTTGSDLRRRFRNLASGKSALFFILISSSLFFKEPIQASIPVNELEQTIQEVSQHRDFVWRMPPEAFDEDESGPSSFSLWVRNQIESLDTWLDANAETIARWWRRLFPEDPELRKESDLSFSPFDDIADVAKGALVLLVVLLVIAILVLLFRTVRSKRHPQLEEAEVAPPAMPDLHREDIMADELPADEWLDLANELHARGEHRLALRALFLAFLARLADRRLLVIRKAKSNRDYERELRSRGGAEPVIVTFFSQFRKSFDSAWYGNYPVAPEEIDRIRDQLTVWGKQT